MSRNTALFDRVTVETKLVSKEVQELTDKLTNLQVRVSRAAGLADTSIAIGDIFIELDTLDVYYKNEQT